MALLIMMLICIWYFDRKSPPTTTIKADSEKLTVMDGDSFVIGSKKFRLKGIDAPELHQTCTNAQQQQWACGVAARETLVTLLAEPRLTCDSDVIDRYGRGLAVCNNIRSKDIAADQVRAGMAVSDDFYGVRSYGDEEDSAHDARRGIWAGEFIPPAEWRSTHPLRTPVEPS
jgi:endonuclease YncB( thermonuclease family)